ncbi:MAG: TonB-dependent receptor, partial [Deltaproteobacteria bacterium]|nr:TonB-dependent receptor [Deltaproteobacteria bacterium]
IVGGGARTSWLASNELLDGETYADPSSSRFHEPGIDHFEARAGAFIHSELAPVDWVTITGGLRFDYNTITEEFLSPRLAVVFQPVKGQFLRLGVARAFRMPAFFESTAHPLVEFPDDSPITGTDFLEFMTKVVGNSELDNEKLLSLEAGYLGRFLDGRLAVNLDLYCNFQTGLISIKQNIVADELLGLPDLDESQVAFGNFGPDFYILGSELSIRFNLTKSISLLASWTHREVFLYETGQADDTSPKNLITLGGRFRTDGGLLGSLYVFTRSEFQDRAVENPRGLLETELQQHLENVVLILGKFGWKIPLPRDFDLEIGLKLFMPISPFKAPHFRYREKGGLLSASGENFGGEELPRVVTIYLQGSI